MTDTPLYDATLSDQLLRARREGELARGALAERAAAQQVAAIGRLADERVAKAEQRAAEAERLAQQVRTTLAFSAPPLPVLRVEDPDEEPLEREAPAVPTMEELMRPMPGITRFLDSLLGVQEH